MKILIAIIAILVLVAIVGSILEWLVDNIVLILVLVASIAGCYFFPDIAIPVLVFALIVYFVYRLIAKNNRTHTRKSNDSGTDLTVKSEGDEYDGLSMKDNICNTDLDGFPGEAKDIIIKGREYIQSLHGYNDCIPGTVVSAQLQTMEETVRSIVSEIEKNPEKARDAKKVFDYYLPTIDKVLSKYAYYETNGISGDNATKTREEIEQNLEVMNKALIEFQNRLYQDDNLDISAELSVMKRMMEQDGVI